MFKSLQLTDSLYDYLYKVSLRESALLAGLREETLSLGSSAVMQIAPEQGQFMALLLRLMQARKVLELGTFTGYSSLVMAQALPQDGTIITCDISENITKMAKKYWELAGVAHKIDLRLAPALETLSALQLDQKNTFDFIFIDADKNNYDYYYEAALTLLRPNGLLMIDNVLWSGAVIDINDNDKQTLSIRALNQKISLDTRVQISLLPVADGITLAIKL